MKSLSLLFVCLAACDPNGSGAFGTSVGNPGKESFRLAPPLDESTEFVESSAFIDGQYLVGCDGTYATVLEGEDVNLLGGPRIPVPAGTWCALVLDVGSILVEATFADRPVTVEVLPDGPWTWWMREPVIVDETEWVIELGAPGWLGAEDVPDGTETTVITDDGAASDAIGDRLALGSVFEDTDGDGEVSEEERGSGSLASQSDLPPGVAEDPEAEVDDEEGPDRVALDGCGNCSAAGGPAPAGAVAVLALALIRRRRPRA